MEIRRATPADLDTLVAMKAKLWESYSSHRLEDFPEWPAEARAAIADMLGRDTHLFLVAVDGGRTVGCLSAGITLSVPGPTWSGRHATLGDMWVEPDQRGRGTARALMDRALEWCRDQGCAKVNLHSTPAAVRAYERMGFHVAVPSPDGPSFPVMWLDF